MTTTVFQSFTGEYAGKQDGGTVKLSLKQASDGSVSGTFNDGSSNATLSGSVSGGKITGQFNYQGINLPFEIRRKGAQIEFVMKFGNEEEAMTLSRTGGGGGSDDSETPPTLPSRPTPSSPGKPASFAGTFKGAELTLTLSAVGEGKLAGTITMGEKKYPARASQVPQGIEGSFQVDGESFEFLAKFEGDQLLLNSGGTIHVLVRQGGAKPANPLAAKPTPEKPKATNPLASKTGGGGAAPAASGASYTHPAGLALNLPQGWKVQQNGILTALLPPGATKVDGDELYLLMIGEANGIQSKRDPRLTQFLEFLLNGPEGQGGMILGPGVTFQPTDGPANGLTYQGGRGGNGQLYVRCVVSEPKGRVAAIVALGLKSRIAARESALQSAMASVRATSPEHDPRLVGNWKGTTQTKSLDARDAVGRQQASSVSDSSISYQLTGDGRFVESKWSRTIAIGQGVSLDSGDNVERTQGQWVAGNGKIAFTDEHGLYIQGTYQIQGGSIVIQVANKIITLSRG